MQQSEDLNQSEEFKKARDPPHPMTKKRAATPPTTNKHLIRWVEKMADLTQPAAIHWVDGSQAEYERLCDHLVEAGTFYPLDERKWPGCFYARSSPNDVARIENRTFICSLSRDNAGPTNNWLKTRMRCAGS
jgi:phosphoenolpyruvate carboxykinase (GTP)